MKSNQGRTQLHQRCKPNTRQFHLITLPSDAPQVFDADNALAYSIVHPELKPVRKIIMGLRTIHVLANVAI
jgi:hypothetical protein